MTINHLELVSALVDGQLTGNELEQALGLIANDPHAREAFMRYQQASDILHGYTRSINHNMLDLTARISASLADEPVYSIATKSKSTAKLFRFPENFWKQATGLAMAASVGALAVVGVVQQQSSGVDNMPMASVVADESPATLISQSNRWTVAEPEIEDRLNNYLVDHNEYVGTSGMFSYGRVVSYGTER
ncbi:sigma-E factor negative regulatory protein [Methylophaga pinxianii]|uniref:sigma-E factor negative regulatory protein n=1 Tax=Methylophaga pinxianii TaxID=2881052 RepID=UPI001CF308FE|nr:sigma-E factor negative regulatory protein [Methylophaga pinxianii]MCB2427436.1 sigma-E factor negative regulatory protein [Methylophaga pinxianii]UPH45159.1 sigma-E factor negative regulatory protein [Methylophaga pinxianii]